MFSINICVLPNSKKTFYVGMYPQGVLKIKIAAPPVDHAANKELIKWLANTLKIRKSHIEITHGQLGRNKTVTIQTEKYKNVKEIIACIHETLS